MYKKVLILWLVIMCQGAFWFCYGQNVMTECSNTEKESLHEEGRALCSEMPFYEINESSSFNNLSGVHTDELLSKRFPSVALKTNIALLGIGVTNLGVEFKLKERLSLDVPFIYSPYTIHRNWNIRILAIQPEFRYWLTEAMSGHFFGAYGHIGFFNVAFNDRNRYQDKNGDTPAWGLGVGYGYSLPLSDKLGFQFNVGVGFTQFRYDSYYNVPNGAKHDTSIKNYWGISRLGVSFYYVFNKK